MTSPRHLWTGEWRSESDRARQAAEDAAAQRQPLRRHDDPAEAGSPPPSPDAPSGNSGGSRRTSIVLGVVLAIVAIAAGAFAAGTLIDGNDDGNSGPNPLAAVDSAPIRPHRGETQAAAIYAAASPAVVSIRTSTGSGTGFLIDDRGTLVTNDHVVDNQTHVTVNFGQSGQSLDGDVIGSDPSSDLAVVSIPTDQIPRGARPLTFADSRAVKVGDTAIAIGNPLGLDRTATEGIVSGLGRSIQSPNGYEIDQVIQTDAPINPGNSGGPLLDDGGHVIGVNSQIATAGSQGNIGIGFAIPSNTVRAVVPRLERGEAIQHAYLGVSTSPTSLITSNGADVAVVRSGSPADKAGLKVGDVITQIDSKSVTSPDDVVNDVGAKKPGDEIAITIRRDGREQTVHATLGNRPRTP